MTDPIRLVATERGFVKGRMVEAGAVFLFDPVGSDGKDRKIPRWAVKEADAKPPKEKPKAGDLKPQDTQAAVKRKMAGFSGEQA